MPRTAILLLIFSAAAIALACPDVRHLATIIPGDSGDAILNLWILRAVQSGIPHGWRGLWNAPIYSPELRTLAYSDAMLPIALAHWPLRLAVGDAFAFNILYLASWIACSWSTWRLAERYTHTSGAALVGALAFTYASVRLVHHQHFQLVVGGALVPLAVLALVRCLTAPSPARGLLSGLTFAVLALTSTYYGAMTGIMAVVIVAGGLIVERPSTMTQWKALTIGLGLSALVAAALVGPVAAQYVRLQRRPEFRRTPDAGIAAHVNDFLSTSPESRLLASAPLIGVRSRPESRGIENRLFPGLVATPLALAGLLAAGAAIRRRATPRTHELLIVVASGFVVLVLAFGDRIAIGGREIVLPFAALRRFAPGFAGIRATARLALGGQLAIALLAAFGFDAFLRHRSRNWQLILTGAAMLLIAAESATGLASVRVPGAGDDGGVMEALAAQPGGVVLELPIESSARGVAWPYVEMPRQLVAIDDGHTRVNGYSGFEPPGFAARTERLNRFPDPAAVDEARRLGVRFVVLRTALVGTPSPASVESRLSADGVGRYADATAGGMLRSLAAGQMSSVVRLRGAYLIELRR